MSRLTEKNNRIVLISNYSQTPSKEKIAEADRYNKLAELEDLEEQIGCPLEVREQALKQSNFKGLFIDTVDNDGREWKGFEKCSLMYDAFNDKFYWCNGYFAEYLSNYKKTWWLKKDKSE